MYDPAGHPDQPRVYAATKRVGWAATGLIAGGTLFLGLLVVIFLLSIAARSSPQGGHMPGLIGGLSVVGIGLIARGVYLLRSVVRVVIDGNGMLLEGFISRQHVFWAQVRSIRRDKKTQLMGGSVEFLSLLDAGGRTIARVPDTLADFENLAGEIAERSAAVQGRVTLDPQEQQRFEARRERRTKWAAVALAGLMLVAFGGLFCYGIYEWMHVRQYATDGVRTDARIVRRYMVRVTPRLEYAFEDARGRHYSREVMMEQPAWDTLEGRDTIPVEYLASNPNWNRPLSGERAGSSVSGGMLFLSGGLTLLLMTLIVLILMGVDLKTEKGVTRLMYRGRAVWQTGMPTPPAIPPITAPYPTAFSTPVPYPPASFASVPAPARARKPAGLIALGVVAIILGLGGTLLAAGRLVLMSMENIELGPDRVVLFETTLWMKVWVGADGVLAFALVVVGVGLVATRRWARQLGIMVAVAQLVSGVAGMVVVINGMRQTIADTSTVGPDSQPMVAGAVGAVVFQILGLIFPGVLLAVLAKRSTAEALTSASLPASHN